MNLAAAMVAVSLFGIDQTVVPATNGKAEEYVIRLNQGDMENIRGGRRIGSAIAPDSRGGMFYRIYMAEQPDRRATEDPNPQNIDVQLKPSSRTDQSVFSIALSEGQLRDLEGGAVFGGTLPTGANKVGVRFEFLSANTGVAPDEDRLDGREPAPSRPNEVRNPRYRDDLPRSSPIARDQNPAGYDENNFDPPYADRIRQRAATLGDSLPPMQPTSIVNEIRRRAALRTVAASPASPNFPTGPGKGLYTGELDYADEPPPKRPQGTKIIPNSGASISKDSVGTPGSFEDQSVAQKSPFQQPILQPAASTTYDPKLALAVLLGLLSLGANFFLGYQVFGWYMKYRDVIDQVRMGNNWSNDSRTSTI